MKALRPFLAGLAFLAAAASPALAQQETLKFNNGGSVYWDYPGSGAAYVGPYSAKVLSEPGQPTIDVYCVDFEHSISNGHQWDALYSNVMGDLSQTRAGVEFGQATARTMYQQAAFLTTQYDGNAERTRAIQAAIWDIFYTGAPNHANMNYWRTFAQNNYLTAGIDYSTFAVLTDMKFVNTDNPLKGTQEFLTSVPSTVTPEPGTYLLMATGLAGVAGIVRRRRKSIEA
jgi:hypothetical protein